MLGTLDTRNKSGQGDLELFSGRRKQPESINRTAVDLIRPSMRPAAAEGVDHRVKPGDDD
jgi:hypothetical protein